MSSEFAGKTVAVSGAAIGFGHAIATRFAEAGARVFGCDILDPAAADAAGFSVHRVDLLDRKAGADWIRSIEVKTGGAIDILVCNAGGVAGQVSKPLEDVGDEPEKSGQSNLPRRKGPHTDQTLARVHNAVWNQDIHVTENVLSALFRKARDNPANYNLLGAVFEAAAIAGVPLFETDRGQGTVDIDRERIGAHRAALGEMLALLPTTIARKDHSTLVVMAA